MTFGTLYLLFLAVCTVFFSVKSEAIKNMNNAKGEAIKGSILCR